MHLIDANVIHQPPGVILIHISPVCQHHDQNFVCPYNENLYYVYIIC